LDGPYNQHLASDVGVLSLALAVVTTAALVTRSQAMVRTAGAAWLVSALPHLVFHLGHRSQLPTGDQMASLVGLALQVVLASLCLVAAPPSAIVPAVFRPLARHGHLVVDHPDQAVDAAGHRPRLVDVLRPSQRGMADSTCRKNQRPLSPLGRVDPPNQLNGVSWPRSIQQS
jgi:hypothetical protein